MSEAQIDAVAREKLTDVFVVVSEMRTDSEDRHFQRRVHLSLTAAQRAARRAQERGCEATVRLCRLIPVEPEESP